MTTNQTPTAGTLIQPYLFFNGRCEEALILSTVHRPRRRNRHAHAL